MNYIEFVDTKLEFPTPPKWHDSPRWWLVKKLGGVNPHETAKVVRIPIDGKTFMDKLYKQRRVLFKQFNRHPKELLVGAEEYEEMMDCPAIRQSFSFAAEYAFGQTIMGLNVRVIPWMRGILVMP